MFKKIIFFILLFVLFSPLVFAQDVVINEIMYNPEGSDSDHEWIELYNNGSEAINLTGWKFVTDGSSHTLNIPPKNGGQGNMTILTNNYVIISQNAVNFLNDYSNYTDTVIDSSWSDLLNSANETLALKNSTGSIVEELTYSPDAGEGNTICRYPDGSSNFTECTPTPGAENNYTIQVEEERGLKLEVCLDGDCSKNIAIPGTEYTKLFKITNLNYTSGQEYIISTITYNITNFNGSLVKADNFTVSFKHYKTANTGEWTPTEAGDFIICGNISGSTVNETEFSDNLVCQNISVVENPLTLISYPTQMGFGSYNTTFVKLNTSYYEYNKTRFLIYGKSKRVVSDNEWNKITSYATCQGSMGLEINTTQNNTYFLAIPFFMYPNCDNDYSDGEYELALRVCNSKGSEFEKYSDYVFSVDIQGENDNLCLSCPSSSGGGSSCQTTARKVSVKSEYYKIVSMPEKVYPEKEFITKVKLENKEDESKEVSVYSYAYDAGKCISEGYTGKKWSKAWTANKKDVTLSPKSSVTIELVNRIRKDTFPGNYKFRVRVKDPKQHDVNGNIEVLSQTFVMYGMPETVLSCANFNDTVFATLTNLNENDYDFTLFSFSREGMDIRDISMKGNQTKQYSFENSDYYFLLMHGNYILDNCSVSVDLRMEDRITGSVLRSRGVIGSLFEWLRSLF